jgi:hypothetical protein
MGSAVLFAIGLVTGSPAFGQVGPPDARRTARLTDEMDSDDFIARERATDELYRIGKPAVEPLRARLAGRTSVEFRARAERFLRLHEGVVENGLSFFLSTDRTVLPQNEEIVVTLRVGNCTKEAINFFHGLDWDGNYFSDLSTLRRVGPGPGDCLIAPRRSAILCGDLRGARFIPIQPRQTIEFAARARLQRHVARGREGWFLAAGYYEFPIRAAGVHRFCVEHVVTRDLQVREYAGELRDMEWRRRNTVRHDDVPPIGADGALPFWIGNIRSNQVVIEFQAPTVRR